MSENLLDDARTVLSEMLNRLGSEAEVLISDNAEEPRLELKSSQAGRLIGRKGQNLEALELVLNRILRRQQADEESTTWVGIEVDGYSVPHKNPERHGRVPKAEMEQLEALALDVAKEVKTMGESKVIGPFKPGERRIIHMTLRSDPVVETVSDPEPDQDGCKMITIQFKAEA